MADSDLQYSARFFDELELLVHQLPLDETLDNLQGHDAVPAEELPAPELQSEPQPDPRCATLTDDEAEKGGRPTSPTPPRTRNPSRERKQSELVALREEAKKLELQRTLLLLRRKRHAEAQIHGTSVAIDWKKAAQAELMGRQRAEAENARLTSVLNQQMGLSEALTSLVRKRYERSDDGSAMRSKRFQPEASLGMLHAQFLQDIRRVYENCIERFFVGNAWVNTNTELGLTMIREARADSLTEEMRDTRHLPFKYDRVVEAAWRCSLHPFLEDGRLIESYGSEDDQLALKYRALTSRNADRGDLLTAVMVVKRFVESDRTIHVWRSMLSSNEVEVDVFQRAYSDETGWIVIERVPEGVPGLEAGTAVVRIVAQLTPLWPSTGLMSDASAASSTQKLQPQDFLELVVDATHDDLVALTGAIETMLLDESAAAAVDSVASI